MKKKGSMMIEIIISIAIFSIAIFPTMKLSGFLLSTSERMKKFQMEERNFYALTKILSAKTYKELDSHLGGYSKEDDYLKENMLNKDVGEKTNIKVLIEKVCILDNNEEHVYIQINVDYNIEGKKTLKSVNLVGENHEK